MKEYSKYKSNMAFSRMDPYYDLESQSMAMPRKPIRPYSAKRWVLLLFLSIDLF